MKLRIQTITKSIDWQRVADLLSYFGLSHFDASTQQKVFENSYAVVFLFDGEKLIGCGRAISDGICQAAIYNIAVDEQYHGQGLGRKIMENLIDQVSQCNIILYTHPKTVNFYEHLGFYRMKTAMTYVKEDRLSRLKEMNFI